MFFKPKAAKETDQSEILENEVAAGIQTTEPQSPIDRLTERLASVGVAVRQERHYFTDVTVAHDTGEETKQFSVQINGHITEKECRQIEDQARIAFGCFPIEGGE